MSVLLCQSLAFDAHGEARSLRVEYRAPSSTCPSAREFEEAVLRQTETLDPSGSEPRVFSVTIFEEEGGRHRGHLEIVGPAGETATRDLVGDSCRDVASALALTVAVALDPQSRAPTNQANSSLEPSRASETAPLVAPSPWSSVTPRPREQPARSSAALEGTDRSERPWAISLGIMGSAKWAAVPSIGWGGGGWVEIEHRSTGALAPSVRLAYQYNAARDALSGIDSSFDWVTARLEGCPLRWHLVGDVVQARPCALFEAGLFRGRGVVDHPQVTPGNLPWLAPGVLMRLAWSLTPRIAIDVDGGAIFPLHVWTFTVTEGPKMAERALYSTPHVAGLFNLGVGYQFP
jgi:hypothetical protein